MSKPYHGTSTKPSLVPADKPTGDGKTNNAKIFQKFHEEFKELKPGSPASKASNLDSGS